MRLLQIYGARNDYSYFRNIAVQGVCAHIIAEGVNLMEQGVQRIKIVTPNVSVYRERHAYPNTNQKQNECRGVTPEVVT